MKVNATLSKTIEAMKMEMISRDELNKKSKNLSSKLDQKGRTLRLLKGGAEEKNKDQLSFDKEVYSK